MQQLESENNRAAMPNRELSECDWLTQQELARMLRISERTASVWARQGRLRLFEHGVANAGRRRYSRSLFHRYVTACMKRAEALQDAEVDPKT